MGGGVSSRISNQVENVGGRFAVNNRAQSDPDHEILSNQAPLMVIQSAVETKSNEISPPRLLQPKNSNSGNPTGGTGSMTMMNNRSDEDLIAQINLESDKLLLKCNIPLFRNSSQVRKEFLKFIETDRVEDMTALLRFIERKIAGREDVGKETNIFINLLQLFPIFLTDSIQYSRWYRRELGLSMVVDSVEMDNAFEYLYENVTPVKIENIFDLLKSTTIKKLPDCRSLAVPGLWFETFASAVEYLPLVVLLTLPDRKNNFPIVYANRQTEITTGYSRVDLHGEPNIFLNSKRDPEKSEELLHTLACSVPFRTKLSVCYNIRKDGEDDNRLVTMLSKPLYDAFGRYRYSLTILTEDDSRANMVRIGCFLSSVPNVIFERN